MAESPLSPGSGGGVSEVGMNVVVDLHSSASAVLNENSTAFSDAASAGIFVPVDLQCPATPQLTLKLPDLSSSSSDTDEELALAVAGALEDGVGGVRATTSPPPNCAICLGRCKNKCFTDSCMHQFCFKCLCEWSKVKPECPLCKQTFKSIIHNVKSIDQFEEYHVVTPPTLQLRQTVELNMLRHIEANIRLPHEVDGNRRWENFELALSNVPRAHRLMRTARTTFYPSSSSAASSASASATGAGNIGTVATSVPSNANVQNQFVHRGELLDMYRQEYPDAITSGGSLSGTLSQLWRRYVYDRKLYALPVCDITGRFRDSNARFYRDNPAQIHRLVPWINRDIVCLLRNTEHDVSFVLERINEWLTMTNILSPLFRRRLHPILGTKTGHFIHELNNFARSPYDMIGYDRAVQYSPQSASDVVIEFTSSSSSAGSNSSDEEPVNVVDGGGSSVAAAEAGSTDANNSVAVAASSRTNRSRSRNTQAAQTSASRAREYRVQSRATANTASTTPPMINLLSFTISTTSEGVEAPGVSVATVSSGSAGGGGRGSQSTAINLSTHNRTSDIIIDLDDTDMDNNSTNTTSTAGGVLQYAPATLTGAASSTVLPTPTVTENIELSSTDSSDECEFVLERKPPHLRTPEMVSLNSESDSDVVFVDDEVDRCPNEEHLNKTTRSLYKNLDKAEKSIESKVKTDEEQDEDQQQEHVKEEEYNVGASTSAGLRSSGRRRRQKSIDMAKNKLKKMQRRKRVIRNTKEENTLQAETTTTDSEDADLATLANRVKRMKQKASEPKRIITRKMANKAETSSRAKPERFRKRKHSSGGDGRSRGIKTRRSGETNRKQQSEGTDCTESTSSDSSDDYVLRELTAEFRNTIAGFKKRLERKTLAKELRPLKAMRPVSSDNSHEPDVEVEQQTAASTTTTFPVKNELDEAATSSHEENEAEGAQEDVSNNTANSLYSTQNNEPTDPTTSTEPGATISGTFETQQEEQEQAPDATISLNFQTTTNDTRCSSRTTRSSSCTTTTTTTSESSTSSPSSSSSSSATSDDSDEESHRLHRSTNSQEQVNQVQQQLHQQPQQTEEEAITISPLNMTLDAATTEAAVALASLRNSHQQVATIQNFQDVNNIEQNNAEDHGDEM